MENKQDITLEYVLANTNLTASDFEGIDFQKFLEYYELDSETIFDYHLPDLIRMYLRALQDVYTSYTDIYDTADGKLTTDDLQNIQVIVWEYHSENSNNYMVIDREKAKVYFSRRDIISECREKDMVAKLSREDMRFVEDRLRATDILLWENQYIGSNENIMGHMAWTLGFKLNDGRCIVYSGRGVYNPKNPVQLAKLLRDWKEHFVK